jgi:outer membrane receptor for monomeric catechols
VQVEQVKQQGDAQKTQAMFAHEQQMKQIEIQNDAHKFQAEDTLKQRELQMSLELQRSNDQRQSLLDQQKAELDRWKIQLETDSKERVEIQIANIKAASAAQVARINHGLDEQFELTRQQEKEAGYQIMQNEIAAAKQDVMNQLLAPKRIIRDQAGRVAGVEHGGVVHAVVRDGQGKIIGTQPQAMQ